MAHGSERGRAGALAFAFLAGVALAAPGFRLGGPPLARAQAGSPFVNPDSARADSLRKAYDDSVAYADSVAAAAAEAEVFGGETGITGSPSLLAGPRPEHPLTYTTSYGTLRARRTWDQNADLFLRKGRLAIANRTNVTIIEDPDVKRSTRNRTTTMELGYIPMAGITSGIRGSLSRNSDLIGIRQANSIVRDQDQLFAFTRYDRKLFFLPLSAGVSYGQVKDQQPEFDRNGQQLRLDGASNGLLPGGVRWTAGGDYTSSRLHSIAPTDSGAFSSDDHTTDKNGRGTLAWAPRPWFSLDASGSTRRGVVERPETGLDPNTLENVVVQERVTTSTDNGAFNVNMKTPFGQTLQLKANLSDQQILYSSDSTRTNITNTKGFGVTAQDTLFGANVSAAFQNGTSSNDFTRRPDGYVQESWTRSANLSANRRINSRTGADLQSGISLDSRRFTDFRPSTVTSFPPASQDLLRASTHLRIDYSPMVKFSTGVEGQIDLTKTINLTSATSGNNTDQTGYAVTWRWGFTPLDFWTVSQDNSAGAQQVTYPFAPDRDNISYIYQLRTSSVERLTTKVSLETHYNLRYLSRGSYRLTDNARRFGKSGGTDSYDLLLRAVYQIATGWQFDVSQQTFVTNNFSLPNSVKTIDSQTKRRALYANFSGSRPLGRGLLTVTLRRTMTKDEAVTPTVFPPVVTGRRDDYWQITSSFRTSFDL